MRLTILTPTFNRADKLHKLYESLQRQTSCDFEWLIVDDGSTDNTAKIVEGWIQDSSLTIRYEYKRNGGKHTALNLGIRMITSELTFIVDSDDWLTDNAVDTVLFFADKYATRKAKDKLCGFSFLRVYSNGEVNTGEFPVDEAVDTYRQQRINNNLLGDKAEVFYTEILKEFPFMVYRGEKFMPEDAVWLKMSGPYNMVHINRKIYFCDYLEGGLTKTGRKMKVFSPYGMMYRSKVYLEDPDVIFKVKLKMMILYHVYAGFAGDEIECPVDRNWLYWATYVPAKLLFLTWKKRYL